MPPNLILGGERSPVAAAPRQESAPVLRITRVGTIVRKEVDPVALFALLALIGIALWATGHLIVR
jgi:hypothetical protein